LIENVEVLDENIKGELEEDLLEFSYGEESPKISLHAITGSQHPRTIRLIGCIGNQKVVVLIDSGSTHNFLDSSVCKKTNVTVCIDQRIKVNIAKSLLVKGSVLT
jgi:hypothetical protein